MQIYLNLNCDQYNIRGSSIYFIYLKITNDEQFSIIIELLLVRLVNDLNYDVVQLIFLPDLSNNDVIPIKISID